MVSASSRRSLRPEICDVVCNGRSPPSCRGAGSASAATSERPSGCCRGGGGNSAREEGQRIGDGRDGSLGITLESRPPPSLCGGVPKKVIGNIVGIEGVGWSCGGGGW